MPTAISVWPSNLWQGNDGDWSTFAFRIGAVDPQVVNLLPATSYSSVWPILYLGCQDTDPSNCDESRGGTFDNNTSASYVRSPAAANGQPYFSLPFTVAERAIGYNGSAAVGQDKLWIGTTDDALQIENALIAATARKAPLFLGAFGLGGYAETVRDANEDLSPLQRLKDSKVIASLSYAYHAGAYYNNQQFGSLVLGGYDRNRGDPNAGLAVGLGSSNARDLLLAMRGVRIGSGATAIVASGIPSGGIEMIVDSMVPEIWLPEAGYDAFETAFELGDAWNSTLGYYIISDDLHNRLTAQNKKVVFTLAANTSTVDSGTIDIELPYSAFDMSLRYGKADIQDDETSYRYFPLRRAVNSTQYILGRTFLQAAYLAVNYDSRQFYISQANAGSGSDVDLQCIGETCDNNPGLTPSPSNPDPDPPLSTGAIAGIAVAAALIVLGIIAFFVWRRWSRKRKIQKFKSELTSRNSIGGTTIQEEENQEYFKPHPPEVQEIKPELEGNNTTLGGFHQYGRHELASNGTVRRYSGQSGLTRNSAAVSPIGHHRGLSYESSTGAPSPRSASDGSPSPGQDRWSGGSAPQQTSHLHPHSGGGWYFELPADARAQDVPLPMSPRTPDESSNLMGAAPMEVSSDPRSPVEDPRSAESRIDSGLLNPRTERRS